MTEFHDPPAWIAMPYRGEVPIVKIDGSNRADVDSERKSRKKKHPLGFAPPTPRPPRKRKR